MAVFEGDFDDANEELDAEFSDEIEADILLGEELAADIVAAGTFRAFISERYAIAKQSLAQLAIVDPHDAATIAVLQADIRFWKETIDWARLTLDSAKIAEEHIREQDRGVMSELTGENRDISD